VTSQGSAAADFQRACERGNVLQAETAARQLNFVSLGYALDLVMLYARTGDPKFEGAALRWLGRLIFEGRDIRLTDVQLAAAALGCLRGLRREKAEKTLLRLL
jgi:hypothetical protein